MVCPRCKSENVGVINSRNYGEGDGVRYRRRACGACGHRWSTAELPLSAKHLLPRVQTAIATLRAVEQELLPLADFELEGPAP